MEALEFGGVILGPIALLSGILGKVDEKLFLILLIHLGDAFRAYVLAGLGVELPVPLPHDPLAIPVTQLPIVVFMRRRGSGVLDHLGDRFAIEVMVFGNLRPRPLGQSRKPVGTGHELFAHFAFGNALGPGNDAGYLDATFEQIALVPAVRPALPPPPKVRSSTECP